jgi:hypothetical protein
MVGTAHAREFCRGHVARDTPVPGAFLAVVRVRGCLLDPVLVAGQAGAIGVGFFEAVSAA